MSIPEFLRGFAKAKPEKIKPGDTCREKETGKYSVCLNVYQGMYYGRDTRKQLIMGLIEKFEKI